MIQLLYYIWVFSWLIFLHEFAHWLYFRFWLCRNVEIRFYYNKITDCGFKVGYPHDYKVISKGQYITLYIVGILAGLLPVLAYAIYTGETPYYIMSLLYAGGCISDIKNIHHTIKEE